MAGSTFERLRDIGIFGKELVRSTDIDPIYPILRWLYQQPEYADNPERQLWQTFLYVAYYNLPSALAVGLWYPNPLVKMVDDVFKLPCATERRGHRDPGKLRKHVESYVKLFENMAGPVALSAGAGPQQAFLQSNWDKSKLGFGWNYSQFWETAQTVYGNGRWSAYKWADLLKNVHGWNLAAPDLRLDDCTGPRYGLLHLYGLPLETGRRALTSYEIEFFRFVRATIGQDLLWEEAETILCNYHSLALGRYYVGHDIDELQAQIEHATYLPEAGARMLWNARRAAIPHEYLGELNGWTGVQPKLMKLYKEKRLIHCRSILGSLVRGGAAQEALG